MLCPDHRYGGYITTMQVSLENDHFPWECNTIILFKISSQNCRSSVLYHSTIYETNVEMEALSFDSELYWWKYIINCVLLYLVLMSFLFPSFLLSQASPVANGKVSIFPSWNIINSLFTKYWKDINPLNLLFQVRERWEVRQKPWGRNLWGCI